jgi:8-oxo-dGTP diphosphatase
MTEVRALATDAVILLDGEIVLLERNHEPDAGAWVLPGGFVDPGERAREACAREVREEVGLAVEPISFIGLFDAPNRDERGNVSAAYVCRPTETGQTPDAREEARQVATFDPHDLPETGFDHGDIIRTATEL